MKTKLILWLLFLSSSLTVFGIDTVTLAWNPPVGVRTRCYCVYYGIASRTYTNAVLSQDTSIRISNLVAGATYYFAVTTIDIFGIEGDYSKEIMFTVPKSKSRVKVDPAPWKPSPPKYLHPIPQTTNTTITNASVTIEAPRSGSGLSPPPVPSLPFSRYNI